MIKKSIHLFLLLSIFCLFSTLSFADQPPDPGGSPGTGALPVGGGSPIGGGLIILASLGAAYGMKKIYVIRQER